MYLTHIPGVSYTISQNWTNATYMKGQSTWASKTWIMLCSSKTWIVLCSSKTWILLCSSPSKFLINPVWYSPLQTRGITVIRSDLPPPLHIIISYTLLLGKEILDWQIFGPPIKACLPHPKFWVPPPNVHFAPLFSKIFSYLNSLSLKMKHIQLVWWLIKVNLIVHKSDYSS